MAQQSSYDIKSIASNVEIEIKRLKAQVELFWDSELKHYVEFGLRDGMSVIEVGAGPGFVAEKIAECFPLSYESSRIFQVRMASASPRTMFLALLICSTNNIISGKLSSCSNMTPFTWHRATSALKTSQLSSCTSSECPSINVSSLQ